MILRLLRTPRKHNTKQNAAESVCVPSYTLSALPVFHKDFSSIWLCGTAVRGNIRSNRRRKERDKMIDFKFVNSDVDDMIFDMNDYYISEK